MAHLHVRSHCSQAKDDREGQIHGVGGFIACGERFCSGFGGG
jgi:hypothetical protein